MKVTEKSHSNRADGWQRMVTSAFPNLVEYRLEQLIHPSSFDDDEEAMLDVSCRASFFLDNY